MPPSPRAPAQAFNQHPQVARHLPALQRILFGVGQILLLRLTRPSTLEEHARGVSAEVAPAGAGPFACLQLDVCLVVGVNDSTAHPGGGICEGHC